MKLRRWKVLSKMGRLDLRNVPDEIIYSLTIEAKKEKKSRERYVKDLLIEVTKLKNTKHELEELEKNFYQSILPVMEKQNELLKSLIKKF
ncbi:hypothetical protein [Lactococcus garvieae]|uniref:hypothetical protein n=1 Tax=Lactococcus garvieae TaxID=1363 RepID=UPI001F52A165|nr:hypothetical protein [Lactococcus garvieae]